MMMMVIGPYKQIFVCSHQVKDARSWILHHMINWNIQQMAIDFLSMTSD